MLYAAPTVKIWHENLHVLSLDGNQEPLKNLTADGHIHGGLRIEINGRIVPHLGFHGPDDVCFNEWLLQLKTVANAITASGGRHEFDEGEQGQPAFVFERIGEFGYFSITDSMLSQTKGNPQWQKVEFNPNEFIAAYDCLLTSFKNELERTAPAFANEWLTSFTQQ